MAAAGVVQEIGSHLASKGLPPTTAWLSSFIASQRPNVPVQAQKQTAWFKIQHSDITQSLQRKPASVFPLDIANGEIRERRIAGPLPVQILGIEDIGRSRWTQAEALEAEEKGETTRGREIIRVLPGEDEDTSATQQTSSSQGPHKLIVQDVQGTSAYAMEVLSIQGLDLNINIGAKLLLKDVLVARGVLLLEPKSVTVLGGKIEELHKKWKDGRKEALKAAARGATTQA
jgi:RecQ-mediated genome instability protein 1